LEAKVERPWERTEFKHENLRGWVKKHREEIVTALLTFVQKWLVENRPSCNVVLGSYEEWVKIVGGILKAVSIDGFLENANELYEQLDANRRAWVEFFDVWAEKYGAYDEEANSWGVYAETDSGARFWEKRDSGESVGTKELFPLASHFDDNPNEGLGILDAFLGSGKEQARRVNLGRVLQKHKERVFGNYRLEILPQKKNRAIQYRLAKVTNESGKFRLIKQEASHTADSENRNESNESKSTPSSNGVKTYYTNDLLSNDHFNGPGPGAEIDSLDSFLSKNDVNKSSQDVALNTNESKKIRLISTYKDKKTGEEREVFVI
jgi:hypothetical protein